VIFAERLDRHGDVAERVRVERFPFRIGRAYTNDWIVDDPHVSPEHAVIEEAPDGSLSLRDLGSRNGVLCGGLRVAEAPLAGELVVEIGRTRLRLRLREHAVGAALPLLRRQALLEWLLSHWTSPLVVLALAVALGITILRQGTWRETAWSDWLAAPLVGVAGLALWSGGWALATRFLRQRARFPAHMAVAGLLLLASELSDEGLQFARFFSPSIALVQWADVALSGLLVGLLILGHLRVAAVGGPRQRALSALVAAGLVFGVRALALERSEPDWVTELPYWSRLEPVPVAWLPRRSVDVFFAEALSIEPQLEDLARSEERATPDPGTP
jgi:hypothetical protein